MNRAELATLNLSRAEAEMAASVIAEQDGEIAELKKDLELSKLRTAKARRYLEAVVFSPEEGWEKMAKEYLKGWGLPDDQG